MLSIFSSRSKHIGTQPFVSLEITSQVSVDDSSSHTMAVWNWRTDSCLCEVKAHTDSIFGIYFNPVTTTIVTIGKAHVCFWDIEVRSVGLMLYL